MNERCGRNNYEEAESGLKFIIMFVIGAAAMLAAQWLADFLKHRPFDIDWIYIIGMGIVIALLDYFIPASKRKENRENLKNSFKKH